MCSFYHMELDPGSLVGSLYVPFMYSATSIIWSSKNLVRMRRGRDNLY